MPSRWTALFADDVPFARPDKLKELSRHPVIIGCMIEERAMVGMSSRYECREFVWEVMHDASSAKLLLVSGASPPELAATRDRLLREGEAGVDKGFDVPAGLAQAICGFRHDEDHPDRATVMFAAPVPS